jgi:nitroreductase
LASFAAGPLKGLEIARDPVPQPPAPEVLDFLARRRSASAMTLSEPGPDGGQVTAMISLAARVPDHGKLAPWRFVVLAGADKAGFAARLEAIALARGDAVLAANPKEAARWIGGDDKVGGFLTGKIMRETKGAAAGELVQAILAARRG